MRERLKNILTALMAILCFWVPATSPGQETGSIQPDQAQHFFDGLVMEEEDDQIAGELQGILDNWVEKPLCVNSDQVVLLAEYGLISMYQYHKLREYRMVVGDLLTLYELKNIDGWNIDLARKVAVYLTTERTGEPGRLSNPTTRRVNQQLVVKTSFSTKPGKGYTTGQDSSSGAAYYLGPPVRLGIRYNLDQGDRIEAGLRMEKDQGEPFLVESRILNMEYRGVDHLSAFLKFNFRRLIKTLILGDYRITFGYGLNYSGGRSPAGNSEGLAYPAHRIRANTSMAESGYLRGACAELQQGRFSFTGFASCNNLDGTSVESDSTGKPVSFSSFDLSGLHRSASEIRSRKQIQEQVYGGHLGFTNNWLKAGLISYYQRFNVPVRLSPEAYGKFRPAGRSNLVSGILLAVWLRKIRLAGEFSLCRNGGFAMIAGAGLIPADGVSITLTFRRSGLHYQNLHSAGHYEGSHNDNSSAVEALVRFETPSRWLVGMHFTLSGTRWVSYQLNAPCREWNSLVYAEKSWRDKGTLYLSLRHRRATANTSPAFSMVDKPVQSDKINARLECRSELYRRIGFKTRIETCFFTAPGVKFGSGWVFLQDIGYTPVRIPVQCWIRIGFFDTDNYETRLYAYENDVLYDFSSFMHYGKGIRNVFLLKFSPWQWLDCWFRASSVHYRDRPVISSGWDEVPSDNQQEIEFQVRIRM